MDQASQPFSPALLQMIDQLRPADLRQGAQQDYDDLKQAHPEFDGMVDPSTFDLMERSAAFLKRACRQMTPYEMGFAYALFFPDVLDAQPNELNAVIDEVVLKAKDEAQRMQYQLEYGQKFDRALSEQVERIKSLDKTKFSGLQRQINAFCGKGDFKNACDLLDEFHAEGRRLVAEAARDPEAAIPAFLDAIRLQNKSFQELLVEAEAVPASQSPPVEDARKGYQGRKLAYEDLRTKPDLDAILRAADALAAAAERFLLKVAELT